VKAAIPDYMDYQSKIAVIILAAGASTRMGKPKQLLPLRGRSLFRNAVEAALGSVCRPVVVVIGPHADILRHEVADLTVSVTENREWKSGMSSSLRTGLRTLSATNEDLDGTIIMLCDQPYVSSEVINSLVDARRMTGKNIVASAYGEAKGVPAFFSRQLFGEIASLVGEGGAKQLIADHPDHVAAVFFAQGIVDVDTPQDYELLLAQDALPKRSD